MDTFAEVKRLIEEQWFDCPTSPKDTPILPETRFVEDLQVDSLAVVEMMIAAEETFDIEVPDGEVDNIRTVQEAVDYVDAKLGKK